jgi:hypothetical protein
MRITLREQRRDQAFDVLTSDDANGLTIDELADAIGCNDRQTRIAIHDLRLLLGDIDNVWITCDPSGWRQQWRYRVVRAGDMIDNEETGWVPNRLMDAESRLVTIRSACAAATTATTPQSADGRKARMMLRSVNRLLEDLSDLGPDDEDER